MFRLRRPSRFLLLVAALVLAFASVAIWVKFTYYPSPIEGVCRSLAPSGDHAPVPGDVLDKSAETLDVRVSDLKEPTAEQLEATRAQMLEPSTVGEVHRSVVCLVDYSRTGSPGDPEADPPVAPVIERDHIPALLVYRTREVRISPCFGVDCGEEPTYNIYCVGFHEAATGRVLRTTGCWGHRDAVP